MFFCVAMRGEKTPHKMVCAFPRTPIVRYITDDSHRAMAGSVNKVIRMRNLERD